MNERKALPKELICLSRKSKWKPIRQFLKEFISLTLTKGLPYELIVISDKDNGSGEESVKNYRIEKNKDLKTIDKIKEFESLSIYQFNNYYENNLYLTTNENAIIFFAKYMSDITNDIELECFDFIIMLDSTSNPVFLSNTGDQVDYRSIIDLFNHFDSKAALIHLEDIADEDLEPFIFEQISGRNAVWGGSETKAYTQWKDEIADLFRSSTGKYSYYGGRLTKKYRGYLEKLFTLWQKLSDNGQKTVNITDLKDFISFLELF
jgi:hypothetical protein